MAERWKPEVGERYWVIWINDTECPVTFYDCTGELFMRGFWEVGNCFRTEEEAEYAAEKVKELLLSLQPTCN